MLRQAREPATIQNTAGIEHIRLIFRQAFSVPLIVRVTRAGDRVHLRSVLFTGAETGRVFDAQTKALTLKDWESLNRLANAANFSTMPYEDTTVGFDGCSWVVEIFRDDAYHVVTRWLPSLEARERQLESFVALGRQLARLSPHRLQLQ